MVMDALQNRGQYWGMPGQNSTDYGVVNPGLLAGDTPNLVIIDAVLANGTGTEAERSIPAYTPMVKDANKQWVVADPDAPAEGITLRDHIVPASGDPIGTGILVQGNLNKDALSWPTAYDTDAKKYAAFDGAASPTSIVVRLVRRGSIVAQP